MDLVIIIKMKAKSLRQHFNESGLLGILSSEFLNERLMGKSCPFAHFISQATQRAQ
jgi:hypothetical protein